MRLTLDPWAPGYDTSLHDTPGAEHDDWLNTDLHVELEHWNPVQTSRDDIDFRRVYFVDGRRRTEQMVFAEWSDGSVRRQAPAMLATYAIGLAEIDRGGPNAACRVVHAQARRVLVACGGHELDALSIPATSSRLGELVYRCEPIPDADNRENALERKLQSLMREAEARVAGTVRGRDALLVVDGPIPRHSLESVENAFGYVKTLHDLMLPPAEQRTLFALQRGQRTPVFKVGGQVERFSWFLRLESPPAWHQGLAGVVRLEVHAKNGLAWARAVADWSCANLPRFAAKGFRDPRAPQQLMPVAFLESELGRRMGDLGIIRRRIQTHLRNLYGDDAPDGASTETFDSTGRESRELN